MLPLPFTFQFLLGSYRYLKPSFCVWCQFGFIGQILTHKVLSATRINQIPRVSCACVVLEAAWCLVQELHLLCEEKSQAPPLHFPSQFPYPPLDCLPGTCFNQEQPFALVAWVIIYSSWNIALSPLFPATWWESFALWAGLVMRTDLLFLEWRWLSRWFGNSIVETCF